MGFSFNTRLWQVVAVLLFLSGPASADPIKIAAFGDSLFAGYGLHEADAFPARLEAALKQDGFDVTVVTAAVSGDTTAGGAERVDWMLGDSPGLVIVELGGNDVLRGIDPTIANANLEAICGKIAAHHVPMVLAGMMAPDNLGADYVTRFDAIYPALAKKYNAPLYPFVLQNIMFHPELMQADGIHPNVQGVAIMVAGLKPLVETELKTMGLGGK